MKVRHPARVTTIVLMCALTATVPGCGAGPSTPRLSPVRYRAKLRTIDKPVTRALARIHSAHGIPSLDHRIEHATKQAKRAVSVLGHLLPPKQADREQLAFRHALQGLVADLHDLQDRVVGQELCAPSSVLGTLRTMKSAKRVPHAATALAAAGYPSHLRLPKFPKPHHRRPKTGHFTRKGHRTGLGKLKVEAGRRSDVVVSLAQGHHTAFGIYVRKGGHAAASGVVDGRYTVYFTMGTDWDPDAHAFTRNCRFGRYKKPITFKTITTTRGKRYRWWHIDLHRTYTGHAATKKVDPKDFPGQ